MRKLIDRLEQNHSLEKEEWIALISSESEKEYLFARARSASRKYYGNHVYARGLIEFTNYCRNNCYYCGIRHDNRNAARYRLSEEEILECCENGYRIGFRTFVLQGGEDVYYTDERMVRLITKIKSLYPDCALTLSIGERLKESYKKFHDSGADRYLLRHETAVDPHYRMLHPEELTLRSRMDCLWNLKEAGFQVGCGFMAGSPGQTAECLAEDMLFITKFKPQMVGVGPFIPHHDTPFAGKTAGTLGQTLYMIGLLRLLKPDLLIPATTALGTICENGRELGILAGANVIMPNLSPKENRKKYELYDNKLCAGDEAAESFQHLKSRLDKIGYRFAEGRGDPAEGLGGMKCTT